MTIEVQTSANGKPVTDVSDRKLYAGMIGRESYVFDIGSKCAASLSDANSLMVQDGSVLHNGAHTLLKGTTKFTIPSGLQEQRRSNIAVIRFSIDSKGALGADPIVLSGDPTTGDNPVDPEWIQDNLLDGATVSDMPLYRVVTDGVNALPPEPLFKQIQSAAAFRDSQSLEVETWSNGNVFVRKYGKIVTLDLDPNLTANIHDSWGSRQLGTLEASWTPYGSTPKRTLVAVGNGASNTLVLTVGGNGVIQLQNMGGAYPANNAVWASLSWLTM